MLGNAILFCARISFLLGVSLSLTGCVFDVSQHGSRGVSLSQAMTASANGGGEISGNSSGDTGTSVNVNTSAVLSGGDGEFALVDYNDRSYLYNLPVDVAYSVPLNGAIQSLTRITLTPVSVEDDHNFMGLFVSGDIVHLQPGSLAAKAVDSIWMLESGVSYRYYLTPAHVFFSPYISANVGYQLLEWNYRNPVVVNGNTITSDTLPAIGGYLGIGLAIKRNSHFSLFGEAGFGGTAFFDQTSQGFNNDVFSDFGYFNVKAGISIKF